jgi:phytoene dehydrogenase-like protein
MSNKKVIIIGAGIAGLSGGCYLQMNGYETRIFEAHTIPGGLCTSWRKNGYLFDGCLHSFGALKPEYRLNQWWNEIIDLDGMDFYFHEELCQVHLGDGQVVHFYTDPDKLEAELKAIAPEDRNFIDDFIKAVKHFSKGYDLQLAKPIEMWSPLDYFLSQFRNAPHLRYFYKWQHGIEDMTKNCQSAVLKRVLNQDFFSHYPAYFLLISLGELNKRNAGYPIGGSLQFALKMEGTYTRLGGRVHYNAKVKTIDVDDGQARGITLENGERYKADLVISAADGYQTIFNMLDGKFLNQKIRQRYAEHAMWPSAVLVSLGLKRTFENGPAAIDLSLRDPLVVDGETRLSALPITIYKFDPTLADKGKTCLRVILKTSNYTYWQELHENNPNSYEQGKLRVADALIDILDERLGMIREYVEVVDVATPATFMRYTQNWKGSTQGWEWLPGLIPETISKTLPGLEGFYMVGQWVSPGGGVSAAFVSGRDVARIICKNDRKRFVTA